MARKFFRGLTVVVEFFVRILFPCKVHNGKNVSPSKSIVVCNHVSAVDPVVLFSNIKSKVRFMYKAELREIAIFRALFDSQDFVPVNRGSNDFNAYKKSLQVLKSNHPLGMFPEGTRNKGNIGDMLPLRTGVALYSIKTKSPIVPCYIWKKPKLFARNYILVGEPFELSQYYASKVDKNILDEATEIIRQKMYEVRETLDNMLFAKGKIRKPSEHLLPIPSSVTDDEQ